MTSGQVLTPPLDAKLRLTTLGSVSLSWDSTGGILLGPGKPLALITYLAFSPRRTASRDYLVDLLWGNSDPDRAVHAMRQTVWQVRHILGRGALSNTPTGLNLELKLTSDRDDFLAAVESGDAERTVELYAGAFLPDFAAPGGAEFEHWADLERGRLRTAFLRSVGSLVRRYLTLGRVREAQQLARRGRDCDFSNEGCWRLLLEALEAGNDWTAAAMEADALARFLNGLEREPEPATRAAIRRAHQAPADASAPRQNAMVAELVGREREFATILAAWGEARQGRAHHVHVTAAVGLGKTRLLQDVQARLRAAGARTVYARAHAGERGIAYTFAGDIAGSLASLPGAAGVSPGVASALVSLNPSLSSQYSAPAHSPRDHEALRHRSIALTELLAAVAEESPIALLLDDLHWADDQSRLLLAGLSARVQGNRVLLVTTSRPMAERVFEGTPTTLTLAPLDERQVAALVTSIAAFPDEPWAQELPGRLAWATGGAPLLLLESLQLGLEREALTLRGNTWGAPDPAALAGALGAGSALRRRLEELDPTARRLILSLAVAGTPLPVSTLARSGGLSEEAALSVLDGLEERGLVSRLGPHWEVVHDELASIALDASSSDVLRNARVAVGRALGHAAKLDPAMARHAAPLLDAAQDEAGLAELLRAWVAHSRERGDHRAPAALAGEFLGVPSTSTGVRQLSKTLPWYVRLRLDSPRVRLAVAGVAVAGVVGAFSMLRAGAGVAPPEAVLYVVEEEAGPASEAHRVEVRSAGWEGGMRLPVGEVVRPLPWSSRLVETTPVPAPRNELWVGRVTSDDAGGQDLYLTGPGRSPRRLTTAAGDDVSPTWAPDESAIAFSTARWNSRSHYDLAIQDLASGRVRQLTSGGDSDQEPRWSPDGTRIAFVRTHFDGSAREACWIGVDASGLTCLAPAAATVSAVLGWRDDRRIVIQIERAGALALMLLDVGTRVTNTIPAPGYSSVALSPDGEWLLFQGILPGTPRLAWWVAPLDDPSAGRQVSIGSDASARALWGRVDRRARYLDRLDLVVSGAALPVDAFHQLQVEGRDELDGVIPAHGLAWRTNDTTIATIDSSGLLRPRALGRVTVHVSAGGWRADSIRIRLVAPSSEVILREPWEDSLEVNWRTFGSPVPITVAGPEGKRMFWTRGDSSFTSGVYSRRSWSGREGLGAESVVRVPLTAIQWQTQVLSLDAALDSAALARWDHRTGSIDRGRDPRPAACSVGFPRDQGPPQEALLLASQSRIETRGVPPPADLQAGAPHRLRVQILADGRCGVALDGRPVFLSRGSVPLDRPFRVLLEGMSHGTQVLVGDLNIWTGVPGDVDWREMDGRSLSQ